MSMLSVSKSNRIFFLVKMNDGVYLSFFSFCVCGSNFRGADLSECRLDGCFIGRCTIEGCGFPIMDSTIRADADDEIVRRIVDIGIQMGLNSKNPSDAMKDFLNSIVNLDNK